MIQENAHLHQQQIMHVLGVPHADLHMMPHHFDFSIPSRRFMIIGPMGSGKTEYSLRIFRDAQVLHQKSRNIIEKTHSGQADRLKVAFVRLKLDKQKRFQVDGHDEVSFRGGQVHLADMLFIAHDSFELEEHMERNPEIGTWIIDEASFYDERLAYVIYQASERGLIFILPTLALNFRRQVFNPTATLLLEHATDLFLLSAYCEHPQCMDNAHHTYRHYTIDEQECPAPFFDPLIIIGGDYLKHNDVEPDYSARCTKHHHLPAKEYTYLVLNPLGLRGSSGDTADLFNELHAVKNNIKSSEFGHAIRKQCQESATYEAVFQLPYLAERMLLYLFTERNYLSKEQFAELCKRLDLNIDYIKLRMMDNSSDISFF